jgi:cytochrome P450
MPEALAESLKRIPYLSAVVQEALRLISPIELPLLRVVQPSGAEIAQAPFSGGAVLGLNPWVANHQEDVFPDASSFQPDHWIDCSIGMQIDMHSAFLLVSNNDLPQHPRSLQEANTRKWGYGVRDCTGKSLAEVEIKA